MKDHLSNEVGLAAELTPTGVKARAKSRLIASIDRLLGSIVDVATAPLEGIAQRQRARSEVSVKVIEAEGEAKVSKALAVEDRRARAIEHQSEVGVRRYENKVAVVQAALEDLRTNPPTEDQNSTGESALDDGFASRFERYAEDASNDQLRERWGRVLAGEIRSPGTFSAKVLRIVDEIDQETAALFERLCRNRLANMVPKILEDLTDMERVTLADAGLLVDSEMGLSLSSLKVTADDGRVYFVYYFDDLAVGIEDAPGLDFGDGYDFSRPLSLDDGVVSLKTHVLTPSGKAVASILEHDKLKAAHDLVQKIDKHLGRKVAIVFTLGADKQWHGSDGREDPAT